MAQIFSINPLSTSGENKIADLLANNLPNDYLIYLQPNLASNRPDIVIFHPLKGIFVIEVKDWKPERFYKKNSKIYKKDSGGDIEIASPSEQLSRYINIFKSIDDMLKVTGFLVFPNATSNFVKNFINNPFFHSIGFDNFTEIIDIIRNSNINLTHYEDTIKNFINPPHHKTTFGQKISLTSQQKRIIGNQGHSWKRIRGVAGSGKTLLIAQKAAQIASENKKVLIVTFNKTLVTYIKSNIEKASVVFDWNNIEITHFHGFAKMVLKENDIPSKGLQEIETNIQTLKENKKNRIYDAILIDEAQDIKKEWFDALLRYLSKNDEVLLVADDKQNLYDRKLSWIHQSMSGLGYKFKGAWSSLSKNMRNRHQPKMIAESNRFAKEFLQEYLQKNPDKNFGNILLDEYPQDLTLIELTGMYWHNFFEDNKENKQSVLLDQIVNAYYFITRDSSPQYKDEDVAILLTNTKILKEVIEHFKKAGINCEHTMQNKNKFSIDSPNVKITTVHSFKGMEAKAVIFVSDTTFEIIHIIEAYVALTRATESIVFFNRMAELEKYGKRWTKKIAK